MSLHEKFLAEATIYPWFAPKTLNQETIAQLVHQHQQRLQFAGLKKVVPHTLVKIWPGRPPFEVMQICNQSEKSTLHVVIENTLNMMREVAVEEFLVAKIDAAVRTVNTKIKMIARDSAVESSGLNIKETMSIPKVLTKPDGKTNLELLSISDLDVAEKAGEQAGEVLGWLVSWFMLDSFLSEKNYLNPFVPLVELFRMGLWPLGAVENTYVVFVPSGRSPQIV